MSELLYKIAITKIPGVGPKIARNLIGYCGGVRAVFQESTKALLKIPDVGRTTAAAIRNSKAAMQLAESELAFIEAHQIQPLFYLDKAYPQRLIHYPGSPIMLYYRGTADLNHYPTVAVVGTRTPTVNGIAFCERLIEDLKPYNPLIVSGLAYGVDVTAHRKSLEFGMQTVGVLGHGMDTVYPTQHRKIAAEMVNQGGLLTEYTSQTKLAREHFPQRNRIVAALSDAVVVVESAKGGGSIITANMAFEYNKDVFAVPGRVKDKKSQGCNWLIKTNKAHLLESAEDIAYIMRWEKNNASVGKQRELFVELDERERQVVDLLRELEQASIDRITYAAKMPTSEVASLMLNLEFKGIVKPVPGKCYVLV